MIIVLLALGIFSLLIGLIKSNDAKVFNLFASVLCFATALILFFEH